MIIVIVCANRKDPDAGYMETKTGRRVMFVADPKNAPRQNARKRNPVIYRHPDDEAKAEKSWKEILREYNEKYIDNPLSNEFKLFPAWQLYKHPIYEELVCAFGIRNVFILSGGWGLISADFLTPNYNITFSRSAAKKKPWSLRQERDCYKDLIMLPKDTDKPVVFLGGKEYVSFFCSLTKDIKSKRIIFYKNLKDKPTATGCTLSHFDTTASTNWYYICGRYLCKIRKGEDAQE